jgi:ABC-type phosphate transport system substrate-binding protein
MKLKQSYCWNGLELLLISIAAFLCWTNLEWSRSDFSLSIYQRWFQGYATETGNRVNYQSVGSGAGVRQYIAGTVDFGATDEPISRHPRQLLR